MPMPALFDDRFRLRRPLSDALYGPVGLYADAQRGGELVAIKQVSLARAVAALRRNPNLDNPWSERRVVSRLMALPPHANVVRFRGEFLQGDDRWCVVMDFCPGGDLWDLLEAAPKNRLPEREALQLFAQCARGAQFLHAHGMAHRDLSLENVFYCRGVCKLGDFGLSTVAPLRGRGEAVGKAYYMAPEVVNQQAYDAFAADMWSLGIMLFIMLTGSPLTANASYNNKAFCAFCELGVAKVIDSWGLSGRISPITVALLDKLLSLDPNERPTVDDVVAVVDALLEAEAAVGAV
jgi:serine/threonine protein kinase